MQSLFLTEEDVFEVKIFVAIDEDGVVYCDKNKEAVKFLLEDKEVKIEEYSIFFKKPSFGDLIALTDLMMQNTNKITGEINPLIAKLKTMSHLLKNWNFVDKDGKGVPATEDSFMNMSPIIAVNIGIQFDDFLGEDEIKKNKDEIETQKDEDNESKNELEN